ncbi:hypothetical protein GUJ93_ZPchr0004g40391 [Zizania palustris]|uniref:Uncharacterized protein n=1 Tax=Zizania palustris TaxID=103762 RepID=A0A8J5SPT0_ZIZPA|nr:hypothetical protein GUJ93_ZPchr0004g40391 [Zizania palustris]
MDGHGHNYRPSSSAALPHHSVVAVPDPDDLDLLSQAPASQSLSTGRRGRGSIEGGRFGAFQRPRPTGGGGTSSHGRGVPVCGRRGRGTLTTVSHPAPMGFVPHGGSPLLRIGDTSLGADSGMGSGSRGRFFGRVASSAGTSTLPSIRITGDEEELDDEVDEEPC